MKYERIYVITIGEEILSQICLWKLPKLLLKLQPNIKRYSISIITKHKKQNLLQQKIANLFVWERILYNIFVHTTVYIQYSLSPSH